MIDREWKYFVYETKNIKFAWEGDGQVKGDFDGISLPQFSSATVPKAGQPEFKYIYVEQSRIRIYQSFCTCLD